MASVDVTVKDSSTTAALVKHFAFIHNNMTDITTKYFEVYRRQTYVTPKSYLSFLSAFEKLYKRKK